MRVSKKHLFYILLYLVFSGDIAFVSANNIDLKSNYLCATSFARNEIELGEYQTNRIRKQINLSGEWKAAIENSDQWIDVLVPGVFTFEGTVVFKRIFYIPEAYKSFHLKLVMLGINYCCSIFINDKFIGSHQGGFTSFSFDIDPSLIRTEHENSIRIIVNNYLDPRHTIPLKHNPMSLPNYGGIFREIFLQLIPEQAIENFTYQVKLSPDSDLCFIDLKFFLHNYSFINSMRFDSLAYKNNYEIKIQINSPELPEMNLINNNHLISLNQDFIKQFSFSIPVENPIFWSPDLPYLYQIKIILLAGQEFLDELTLSIGLINYHKHQTNLFSFKQQIPLKGICWYENFQNTGFLVDYEAMERECKFIKELGVNAVRIMNQPVHPYFLKLCSKIGLYVFEEVPIRYLPAATANYPSYKELAEIYLEEMIKRDKIFPCVLGWGISNAVDFSDEHSRIFLKSIHQLIKENDSRLTYIVQSLTQSNSNPIADISFIEIVNHFELNLIEQIRQTKTDHNKNIRIFSVTSPLWTGDYIHCTEMELESMQAYLLNQSIRQLLSQNLADGVFIHCLKDFNIASPCLYNGNVKDLTLQPYGLIDSNFEKRLAIQHVTAQFQNNNFIPTVRTQFEIKQPVFYTVSGLSIILFFLFFYKRQKKLRENLYRSFLHIHGLITDIREQRNIPILSTLILGGSITAILAMIVSGHFYYYRNNFIVDQLLNLILPWSQIKTYLIIAIWKPSLFTFLLFVLFVFFFIIQALLTKIVGYFFHQSIQFIRALTFNIWVASNYILLIPVVLIYYRFLEITHLSFELAGFITLFHVWFLLRLLHCLSILFNTKLYHIILTYGTFISLVTGSVFLYYQRYYAFFDYIKLYLNF